MLRSTPGVALRNTSRADSRQSTSRVCVSDPSKAEQRVRYRVRVQTRSSSGQATASRHEVYIGKIGSVAVYGEAPEHDACSPTIADTSSRNYHSCEASGHTDKPRYPHRQVVKHEVLSPEGKALQPAEEQRHVVVVVGFDRHVLQALLGVLQRPRTSGRQQSTHLTTSDNISIGPLWLARWTHVGKHTYLYTTTVSGVFYMARLSSRPQFRWTWKLEAFPE